MSTFLIWATYCWEIILTILYKSTVSNQWTKFINELLFFHTNTNVSPSFFLCVCVCVCVLFYKLYLRKVWEPCIKMIVTRMQKVVWTFSKIQNRNPQNIGYYLVVSKHSRSYTHNGYLTRFHALEWCNLDCSSRSQELYIEAPHLVKTFRFNIKPSKFMISFDDHWCIFCIFHWFLRSCMT